MQDSTVENKSLNEIRDRILKNHAPSSRFLDQRNDIENESNSIKEVQERNKLNRDEGKKNVVHCFAVVGFGILFFLGVSIVFLSFFHLLCPSYSPTTNWDTLDKLTVGILTGAAALKDKLLKLFDS